jgi:hypothetical protein
MLETLRIQPEPQGSEVGQLVLYWVVQREARTGAFITFRSFADYADAARHKANLKNTLGDKTSAVTIETILVRESPSVTRSSRHPPTPSDSDCFPNFIKKPTAG